MALIQRAITSFYSRFTAGINDVTTQLILDHWETVLLPEALRLQLTVQQATGAGLTVINITEQALQTYPNFLWSVLVRLFPNEMNSVQNALTAITGNLYYGFRKDLGPVRSTLYKNVGFFFPQRPTTVSTGSGTPEAPELTSAQGYSQATPSPGATNTETWSSRSGVGLTTRHHKKTAIMEPQE
jgi:hypothetical protein